MAYTSGWFKVSRRIFESSRFHRESAEAFKVLMFILGKAQDPMNPMPGTVQMGETAIAAQTSLSLVDVRSALASLCAADPESRTRRDDGCTIERLEDGSGFRLVNFDEYHPGDKERAEARSEKARHAALARWGKKGASDGGQAVRPEVREEAGPTGAGVLPAVPCRADAADAPEVSGADGGAKAPRQRQELRQQLPVAGAPEAASVPGLRGSEGREASPGLSAAAGGGVALPEVPPGRAPGNGGVDTDLSIASEPYRCSRCQSEVGKWEPHRCADKPPDEALRHLLLDQATPPTYVPSVEYPTLEARRAAEREAHELCGYLEQYVGRSSASVFAEAADYPGAGRMVTRAESCTPARLERTLVTLQDWRVKVDAMRGASPEQAWKARPRVGRAGPAVAPRNSQSSAWDEAEERLRAQLNGGPNVGRRDDQAGIDSGAPGGAVVPR